MALRAPRSVHAADGSRSATSSCAIVPALVHADNALSVNLLGMTFLSKVRWTHDRGKLVLEQ